MNTKNHLLEGISAFFVNQFYYNIYSLAESDRKNLSLTKVYQDKVSNYIRGIKTVKKIYKNLCNDMYKWIVSNHSRLSRLIYSDFIDSVVTEFVPMDYKMSLTRNDIDEIFSSIIIDMVSTMGTFCLRPNILRKIIDEHDTSKDITTPIIYREGLNILNNKKEELIHAFVSKTSQAKDTVSVEVVEKLSRKIEELEKEIDGYKSDLVSLETEIDEYEEREIKYKRLIKLLQTTKITVQTKAEPVVEPVVEPTTNILTVENLQKHIDAQKDDNSSKSSEAIVSKKRVKDKEESSLSSGKKSLIEDNIDGLLLVDSEH